MILTDILGRWNILAWRQDYDDGRITFPLGERLHGFVQYNPDQTMQLLITAANRANFTSGGQWHASDAAKAQAYSSCLSYAGRFAVLADEIHHHVEISLFPNWVGSTQKRKAALINGQLQLIARLEQETAEARTATLIWQRAAASAQA